MSQKEKKNNENRRYLGKVKAYQGQYGQYQKVHIDNPNPVDEESGAPNQYYQGSLIWCDAKTGKKYLIKQFSVRGVSDKALEKGFSNSICIDLDNAYEVQELG